jgi:hypothetical protein
MPFQSPGDLDFRQNSDHFSVPKGPNVKSAKLLEKSQLAKVMDILISVIKTDDFKLLENLPDTYKSEHQKLYQELEKMIKSENAPSWSEEYYETLKYMDALELKPNIFGVGINFNFLLRRLAELVMERTKRTKNDSRSSLR